MEELRVIDIHLEHINDKAIKSDIGFESIYVPRINLGEYLINLEENKTVIMSKDNVLIIKPNSFLAFKFGFSSIQEPYGYVVSDGDDIGANIYTTERSKWNEFYLVTEYLTEEGLKVDKKHISIN